MLAAGPLRTWHPSPLFVLLLGDTHSGTYLPCRLGSLVIAPKLYSEPVDLSRCSAQGTPPRSTPYFVRSTRPGCFDVLRAEYSILYGPSRSREKRREEEGWGVCRKSKPDFPPLDPMQLASDAPVLLVLPRRSDADCFCQITSGHGHALSLQKTALETGSCAFSAYNTYSSTLYYVLHADYSGLPTYCTACALRGTLRQ